MKRDKMYPERVGNISAFRGCGYSCHYCNFKNALRRSPCEKCRNFEPHAHLEVLNKTPPKTSDNEFNTIALTGDISFMDPLDFMVVLEYCQKWHDRTFLIQSKNPDYFVKLLERTQLPENVIIGTTIETNKSGFDSIIDDDYWMNLYHDYADISRAPFPIDRYESMLKLNCRKAITIEPIMDFTISGFLPWIRIIDPEFIYVGYNSRDNIKLPEPSLEKTQLLIKKLRDEGFDVREKLMRKAWSEK